MEKCTHEFTHAAKQGSCGDTYIVIYCKNCGVVSFDQAKQGTDGEYQKLLNKPII